MARGICKQAADLAAFGTEPGAVTELGAAGAVRAAGVGKAVVADAARAAAAVLLVLPRDPDLRSARAHAQFMSSPKTNENQHSPQ